MPPKAIPDRWIPYKACGEVIEGTRIICFKVPLKLNVQKHVREIEKIWDIPTLLEDIPKLGAVIDLTNTARYYNPQDFLKANVMHRKILMPGRVLPPESSVLEFMNAVDEFLGKSSDSLIGVHCTHGLNRTGYMVCRYMRDRLGIPGKEALTRFEVARGYKIERDIYKNGILGISAGTSSDGKEAEVLPVESRRDDVNYRSPLGDDRDSPTYDSRKRFGCSRPNNDRYGYNRYNSNRNNNRNSEQETSNNALFSCYTNRYNSERDYSGKSRDDRVSRTTESPMTWKNGEGSTDNSRRNRFDNHSSHNRNRYEDRSSYPARSRNDKSRSRNDQ